MPEPFFGLFFKYRKFDFATEFLRNGSTTIQSFVYQFVENFKLLYENVKIFHNFHCVRSYSCPNWPRCHVVYTRHWHLKGWYKLVKLLHQFSIHFLGNTNSSSFKRLLLLLLKIWIIITKIKESSKNFLTWLKFCTLVSLDVFFTSFWVFHQSEAKTFGKIVGFG